MAHKRQKRDVLTPPSGTTWLLNPDGGEVGLKLSNSDDIRKTLDNLIFEEGGDGTMDEFKKMVKGGATDMELVAFIREKIPKRQTTLDMLMHLEDYNKVFQIHGLDDMSWYEKPYAEIEAFLNNPPDPIMTIDDEVWANPHGVLFYCNVDKEKYTHGFTLRAIGAVRNYLWYEDPFYLQAAPEDEYVDLMQYLCKVGILVSFGKYFVPKLKNRRKRIGFVRTEFESMEPSFANLQPTPTVLIDPATVQEIDETVRDPRAIEIYMGTDLYNIKDYQIYGKNACCTLLKGPKMSKTRQVIFKYSRKQDMDRDLYLNHYNYTNATYLQVAAESIMKILGRRNVVFSVISSSNPY